MADASALRAHLLQWAADVFDKATELIVADLVAAAPERSGETKAKIRAIVQSSPPIFSAFVESPTPQGLWYEEGTSPHRIVGHPLLAFPMDGRTVIVHSVNHPGQPARPWFHPTLEREWPRALQEAASLAH